MNLDESRPDPITWNLEREPCLRRMGKKILKAESQFISERRTEDIKRDSYSYTENFPKYLKEKGPCVGNEKQNCLKVICVIYVKRNRVRGMW